MASSCSVWEKLGLSEEDYNQMFGSESWLEGRTSCNHLASLSLDLSHIPSPHTPCHSDLSFWCFSCEAFLDAQLIPQLRPVHEVAYKLKFSDSINAPSSVCDSPKFCKCGVLSKLKCSWAKNNPGRRFYGCGKYTGSVIHCDYLVWYDPPTNNFHANLFNDLCEKIKILELEVKAHKTSTLEKLGAISGKNNISSTLYEDDLGNYIKKLKIEVEVQKTTLKVLQQKVGKREDM